MYLDEPLNIAIGEKYTVSTHTIYDGKPNSNIESVTFNPKLSFVNTSSSSDDAFPNDNVNTAVVASVDIIIGPIQAELPDIYQVARTTMDDIAEEVQRITGAETKLTTDDIQSGLESVVLQEKSVTPSTEPQTIVPDAGYYGISKVTVGAVEESGGGSMFATSAVGILPTVYKGTANSEFTLEFESSAVGALQEV